jgi:hypothetical protein
MDWATIRAIISQTHLVALETNQFRIKEISNLKLDSNNLNAMPVSAV